MWKQSQNLCFAFSKSRKFGLMIGVLFAKYLLQKYARTQGAEVFLCADALWAIAKKV
jgi:hypothetical protein